MFQWIRTSPLAFTGQDRPAPAVTPFAPVEPQPSRRAAHAQALAYAAARRRRGMEGADAAYWRAMAPLALARARAIRSEAAFQPLP